MVLFVLPLQEAHHWAVADIQFAFTLFIALETWGTPINGWIADSLGPHFGPRVVMGIGGILVAAGWIINSYSDSLGALYLGGRCPASDPGQCTARPSARR
jgi:MFS transporter, OFA family, oxalate/formate antiporter